MSILLLILGVVIVRILALLIGRLPRFWRATFSTAIAVIIGICVANIDFENMEYGDGLFNGAIDAFLRIPAYLAIGTSFMAITLGWESDGGYWNESFRIGNTSYGRQEGNLGLMGIIIWSVLISAPIYLFLFIFNFVPTIIYFIFTGIVYLKAIFTKY